jgi:hypothetical protein
LLISSAASSLTMTFRSSSSLLPGEIATTVRATERLRTQGRRETHPGDDERHRRQCELQREGAGMAEPIAVA